MGSLTKPGSYDTFTREADATDKRTSVSLPRYHAYETKNALLQTYAFNESDASLSPAGGNRISPYLLSSLPALGYYNSRA